MKAGFRIAVSAFSGVRDASCSNFVLLIAAPHRLYTRFPYSTHFPAYTYPITCSQTDMGTNRQYPGLYFC